MFKKEIYGLLAAFLLLGSCQKDTLQTYTCTDITPTYTNDIKKIFDEKCATSGCHNASSKAAGIDLSTYAGAKAEVGNSALLGAIEQLNGYISMPQGSSKLPDSTIQKIYCWVNSGAPQ